MGQAQTTQPKPKFTPEQVELSRKNIRRAFELAGLVDEFGNAVCPKCGRTGKTRIKFFPGGGFQCYSSDWCNGGDNLAVTLLVDRGWKFTDAVAALLGLEHNHPVEDLKPVLNEVNGFQAVVDSDVYEAIVACGDRDAAVAYFGRWHIAPEAVDELGTSVIVDVAAMRKTLLSQFGMDRLVAAGVVRPGEEGRRDYWVINKNYPVLEPHRSPSGRVVGLQARASEEREARHAKHVAYSAQKRQAEDAGVTFRDPEPDETYVGKFSSLRGGRPGLHLVGGGLPRLAGLKPGNVVYVVEGIKDLLAMRTLGFEAYALPGVGVAPPPEAVELLARHTVMLSFDADDGGDKGVNALAVNLAKMGVVYNELGSSWAAQHPGLGPMDLARVGLETLGLSGPDAEHALAVIRRRMDMRLRCLRKRPPDGMDVADVLVSKNVSAGCTCPTCTASR